MRGRMRLIQACRSTSLTFRKRRIPKGFRLKAQGCEARATLGEHRADAGNPNGVVPVCAKPRSHNPVGVVHIFYAHTQGSSCLATLGWRTQSLWDWKMRVWRPLQCSHQRRHNAAPINNRITRCRGCMHRLRRPSRQPLWDRPSDRPARRPCRLRSFPGLRRLRGV
jgi:hypothetical protein